MNQNLNEQPILVTLPQPVLTPQFGTASTEKAANWNGLDPTHHPKVEGAIRAVVAWYNRGSGALILAGNPGCGKTHLAKVVYEKYGGLGIVTRWHQAEFGNWQVEQFQNAVFYSEPEMFAAIRQSYGNQDGKGKSRTEAGIIRDCQESELFILDDLGVAHIKDESLGWAQDIYWRLFDARMDKFTLVTTNLTISEWCTRIGRRAFSRLMQALGSEAAVVDMFGIPDYRLRDWQRGLGQ